MPADQQLESECSPDRNRARLIVFFLELHTFIDYQLFEM